jgi:hypothetical protein
VARFGKWPSFHDAEVMSICCRRPGPDLEATIRVWQYSAGELDNTGHLLRIGESTVTLRFRNIRDLVLDGFNHQNVLGELAIEPATDGLKITLYSLYGLGGSFLCDSAEVVDVVSAVDAGDGGQSDEP